MDRKYNEFELKDFVSDDFFLKWKFFPSEEVNIFWNKYTEDHPEQEEIIAAALNALDNIQLNESDITDQEIENLYDDILFLYDSQKRQKTKRIKFYKFIGYTASIAILCLVTYNVFHIWKNSNDLNPDFTSSSIVSDTTSIKLYVNNKEFSYDEDINIEFNSRKNSIHILNKDEVQNEISLENKMVENKIVVPNGKRSRLLLSDGTLVYLNSGTTMQFPSQFKDIRSVKVEGEIYLSVQKDEDKPFVVQTKNFDVKVLGTSFNLSAYSSDSENTVVLEEGSVEINSNKKGQSLILSPGEMFLINENLFQISKVDTYKYSSWKDGVLYFTGEPLKSITAKLSRYYGVDIYCDVALEREECTGKLVLFDDFEEVLKTLTDILPIEYSIENNIVNIIYE